MIETLISHLPLFWSLSAKAPVISILHTLPTIISISWTSAGSVVDRYEVSWRRDISIGCPDDDKNSANVTDGSTSYIVTGLEEDSIYELSVTAFNAVGTSSPAPTIRAMTHFSGWLLRMLYK